jgi:hypothetical protein
MMYIGEANPMMATVMEAVKPSWEQRYCYSATAPMATAMSHTVCTDRARLACVIRAHHARFKETFTRVP